MRVKPKRILCNLHADLILQLVHKKLFSRTQRKYVGI